MAKRSHMDALKAHSAGLISDEKESDYSPYRGGDWNDEELYSQPPIADPKPEPQDAAPPVASRPQKRTRLNISNESRDRLRDIVQRMRNYGVEKDLRASQILEALILALDEAKPYIDMSNVGRRGRYGSASHKTFSVTLAVSISRAIAANEREKAGRE